MADNVNNAFTPKYIIRLIISMIVIILAILAADRSQLRWDWSYNARYAVAPSLLERCNNLSTDVRISAIWSTQQENAAMLHTRKELSKLAEGFDRLDFQVIDPTLDRPLWQQLQDQHGNLGQPALYVHNTDRIIRISLDSLLSFTWQDRLLTALNSVESTQSQIVYWLSGHGELTPQAEDKNNGAKQAWRALTLNGFDVRLLNQQQFSELQRIPQESLLIIAGAQRKLGPELIQALDHYLKSGGQAIISIGQQLSPDLGILLRQHSALSPQNTPIQFPKDSTALFNADATTQESLLIQSNSDSLRGTDRRFDRLLMNPQYYASHPVMDALAQQSATLLWPLSSPLMFLPAAESARFASADGKKPVPYNGQPLLQIPAERAWLATNTDEIRESPAQAFTLAASLERAATSPQDENIAPTRILYFSSRAAFSDHSLEQGIYANESLLVNACRWLSNQELIAEESLSSLKLIRVEADDQLMFILLAVLIVILPLLCIGLAMLFWWDKRS